MRWFVVASVAVTVLLPMATSAQVTDSRYDFMFEAQCAACHGTTSLVPNAVSSDALRELSPERVLEALTTGSMAANASALSEEEKRGMAVFVTGRPFGNAADRSAEAMPNRCGSGMPMGDPAATPHWNGMSPDPTTSARFQPTAAAGLTVEQVPRLRRKWAFGFPDGSAVRGQPTVAGGRVFVGSDNGVVYALDARTGCVHWSFDAGEAVVTAVSVGTVPGSRDRYAAYFGDFRANVYAVDAETGEPLWTISVDDHEMTKITGSPVLDNQGRRLYVPVGSWEEGAGPRQHLVRVLHVPGQRGGAGRRDRAANLEDLHDPRTSQADPEELRRHAALRPIGCGGLGGAHARLPAPRSLRRHGEWLYQCAGLGVQ